MLTFRRADGRDAGQPWQLCYSSRKVIRSHGKRPKYHGYITRGLYNWGRICPLMGDIDLALDWRLPELETACTSAAEAAVATAPEAVFARCGFGQMLTPPPRRSLCSSPRAPLRLIPADRPQPIAVLPARVKPFGVLEGRSLGAFRGLASAAFNHAPHRPPAPSTSAWRLARLPFKNWSVTFHHA